MRKIVISNDKGGVGKTTTVANLAVGSARRGNKTLVVDMDPQADVTYALLGQRAPEANTGYIPPTTFAMLMDHYPIDKVILDVPKQKNLSIIPSNADLANAALRLSRRPTRLRRLLDDLPQTDFDVVLIDTGKGLDPLVINGLAAADEVIVMVTPGRLELDAIARMQDNMTLVRDEVLLQSDKPQIRGILLTMADRYSITTDTLARIKDTYPDKLLETTIPKNNDLQKAIARSQSIFEFAPHSKGAAAYQQLLGELGL